jgi:hypothetical protein
MAANEVPVWIVPPRPIFAGARQQAIDDWFPGAELDPPRQFA